jgi:hypothetical protein
MPLFSAINNFLKKCANSQQNKLLKINGQKKFKSAVNKKK